MRSGYRMYVLTGERKYRKKGDGNKSERVERERLSKKCSGLRK